MSERTHRHTLLALSRLPKRPVACGGSPGGCVPRRSTEGAAGSPAPPAPPGLRSTDTRGPVESAPGAARARTVPGCLLTLMLLKMERDQRPARPEEAPLPWRAPGLGRSPMVAGNREARAGRGDCSCAGRRPFQPVRVLTAGSGAGGRASRVVALVRPDRWVACVAAVA